MCEESFTGEDKPHVVVSSNLSLYQDKMELSLRGDVDNVRYTYSCFLNVKGCTVNGECFEGESFAYFAHYSATAKLTQALIIKVGYSRNFSAGLRVYMPCAKLASRGTFPIYGICLLSIACMICVTGRTAIPTLVNRGVVVYTVSLTTQEGSDITGEDRIGWHKGTTEGK